METEESENELVVLLKEMQELRKRIEKLEKRIFRLDRGEYNGSSVP